MDRYIGLDVHAISCTMAIVGPSGRKLGSHVLETHGKVLIDAIKRIPRPRHLCMEEGTQSAWLYEVLSPHVDELVVHQPAISRGQKNDLEDAFGLANDLRLGTLDTQVFKAPTRYTRLRQLVRTHSMLVRDSTRTQLRLKAMFRERGLRTPGGAVYTKKHRDRFRALLPPPSRDTSDLLFQQFDAVSRIKLDAEAMIIKELDRHPISPVLQTCPAIGPVRTARLMATVVTPHRFRTARQFWSYSGLGIVMRTSSDWSRTDGEWARAKVSKTRGLNPCHNRVLKDVFKGAAQMVASQMLTFTSDDPEAFTLAVAHPEAVASR